MNAETPRYRPSSEEPSEPALERLCLQTQTLCSCERARSFWPEDPESRPQVGTPEAAAQLLEPFLVGHDREHCYQLALDTKHRLLSVIQVSIGQAEHTFIAPREVYRDAVLAGASAIAIGHNHLSGDPEPSADDIRLTRRLAQAGETLGISVLDHLVIGSHDWVSLARRGQL